MSIGWKSLRGLLALTSLSILGSACQQESGLTAPENNPAMSKTNAALAAVGSVNGAAGQMPAFYEGELFTVNMKELPSCLRLDNREESEPQRDLCFERFG